MAFQIMLYRLSAYGISDIGRVRLNNEDSWKQIPEAQFYVLADGMEGHQAGEVASHECVERLCSLMQVRLKDCTTIAKLELS